MDERRVPLRTSGSTPVRLPAAVAPDPFGIEPGALVLARRFCVIGAMRMRSATWQVAATDLHRRIGVLPHHRLELVFVTATDAERERVFAVVDALPSDVRRIFAVLPTDDGFVLVAHPVEAPLVDPTPDQARAAAHDLAQVLAHLHRAGWRNIRWGADDWRLDTNGRVQFADWTWVLAVERDDRPSALHDDVVALQERFDGPAWPPEALRPVQTSAALLAGLAPPRAVSDPVLLSSDAPFVGRTEALRALQVSIERARHEGPTTVTFVGPPGCGKTALLRHVPDRLRADAVFVSSRRPSVGGLVAGLADALEGLQTARRRAAIARIGACVGDGARELCHFDRRFEPWFGAPPTRRRVVRAYPHRLNRLAAIFAVLGEPAHPAVLLVDSYDDASGSFRALLELLTTLREGHATTVVRTQRRQVGGAIELEPLTLDEIAEWLVGVLPGSVPDPLGLAGWLLDCTEGWPGEVVSTLQWTISEGGLVVRSPRAGPRAGEAGWRLTQAPPTPGPEPRNLDEDAGWLALVLAVDEGGSDLADLRGITRWPVDRLRAALNNLRRRALVAPWQSSFEWVRSAMRTHVIEHAPADRVRLAHRALARYLKRRPGTSTAALIRHEELGGLGGVDGLLAQRHLRAAEEQMHRLEFERAYWHFECAAERDLEPVIQRRAQRGRADALLLLDRPELALEAYRVALRFAQGPEDVVAIADRAAEALVHRRPAETLALVDDALGQLGRPLPRTPWGLVWQVVRAWLGVGRRLGPAAAKAMGQLHRRLVDDAPLSESARLPVLWFRGFVAAKRTEEPDALRRSRIQGARGLAMLGLTRWAEPWLLDALHEAQQASDPLSEGLAWLGRAEWFWPRGRGADARHALERAAACFETAGAVVEQARAGAALLVHQLYTEPLAKLERRLRELVHLARRQRKQDFEPLVEAVGLWLQVRSGRPPVPQEDPPKGERPTTVMGVWADAIAALAWTECDEIVLAQRHAERAWRGRQAGAIGLPVLDLALIAAAWVSARRGAPFGRATRRRLRQLRRRAQTNASLEAFVWLIEAHVAIAHEDAEYARRALDRARWVAVQQRQRWLELDVHCLLEQAWAIDGPELADRQRERIAEHRAQLVGVTPPPPTSHADPTQALLGAPTLTPPSTRLDRLVTDLLETLRPHLDGRAVETDLTPGLRAAVSQEGTELLFVSMMLLVHEIADGATLSLRVESRDGGRVALRIVGGPSRAEPDPLTVAECESVARQLGAHFTMELAGRTSTVEATMPGDGIVADHRGVVAIAVDDPRVERMLVEQLRALGWDAMIPGLEPDLDAEVVGGFVTAGRTLPLQADAWTIQVGPRAEGWRHRRELPLPFALDELRTLLDDAAGTSNAQVGE